MDKVSNDGSTPLGHAAERGNADVVRSLLMAGADPNFQGGQQNRSALHRAAARSQRVALETLLEFGADPQLTDSDSRTALELAESRHTQVQTELSRIMPAYTFLKEINDLEGAD